MIRNTEESLAALLAARRASTHWVRNPETVGPADALSLAAKLAATIRPEYWGISCRLASNDVASRLVRYRGKYWKRLGRR